MGKEDADQKKADDAAGKKKADEDAAKKKAEVKRQEHLTQAGLQFMKDKSELRKSASYQIPALYYSSVEVLLREICRIVMVRSDNENV